MGQKAFKLQKNRREADTGLAMGSQRSYFAPNTDSPLGCLQGPFMAAAKVHRAGSEIKPHLRASLISLFFTISSSERAATLVKSRLVEATLVLERFLRVPASED